MALSKETQTSYGTSGSYWKINRISIEVGVNSSVNVEISLYSTRPGDLNHSIQPMSAKRFRFALSEFHTGSIDLIKEAYAKIKISQESQMLAPSQDVYFADAQDVLEEGQQPFDYAAFLASLE
jgi:hypothetical protein